MYDPTGGFRSFMPMTASRFNSDLKTAFYVYSSSSSSLIGSMYCPGPGTSSTAYKFLNLLSVDPKFPLYPFCIFLINLSSKLIYVLYCPGPFYL